MTPKRTQTLDKVKNVTSKGKSETSQNRNPSSKASGFKQVISSNSTNCIKIEKHAKPSLTEFNRRVLQPSASNIKSKSQKRPRSEKKSVNFEEEEEDLLPHKQKKIFQKTPVATQKQLKVANGDLQRKTLFDDYDDDDEEDSDDVEVEPTTNDYTIIETDLHECEMFPSLNDKISARRKGFVRESSKSPQKSPSHTKNNKIPKNNDSKKTNAKLDHSWNALGDKFSEEPILSEESDEESSESDDEQFFPYRKIFGKSMINSAPEETLSSPALSISLINSEITKTLLPKEEATANNSESTVTEMRTSRSAGAHSERQGVELKEEQIDQCEEEEMSEVEEQEEEHDENALKDEDVSEDDNAPVDEVAPDDEYVPEDEYSPRGEEAEEVLEDEVPVTAASCTFTEEEEYVTEEETDEIFLAAAGYKYEGYPVGGVYYNIDDGKLVQLKADSRIFFHGLMTIIVVKGYIEVNGYILELDKPYELYSPRGNSHLYIHNIESDINSHDFINWRDAPKDAEEVTICLHRLGAPFTMAHKVANSLKQCDAVFVCLRLESQKLNFIEKHMSQKLFPTNGLRFDIQDCPSEWNLLKPAKFWDNFRNHGVNMDGGFRRYVLCGGKGVGKSTLLRYLCNQFINRHKKVLVIDLDPGQPEFTVPGCVSATIVTEPLLGPNYTHLKKPEKCIFLEIINIAHSPPLYLKCVEKLLDSCQDIKDMPVLINCMGFTRGVGYEIMVSILHMAKPDAVIDLASKKNTKNFSEFLRITNLEKRVNLFTQSKTLEYYDYFRAPSVTDNIKGWDVEPRHIRDMCVLAYLSGALPKDVISLTDASIPLYETDIAQIKSITGPESLAIIHAQLVGLCKKIEGSDNLYNCYGWGIVRAINEEAGTITIITPLNLEEHYIDYLMSGAVKVPASIYMTADNNLGLVPYIQLGCLSGFQQFTKRSQISIKRIGK